MSNDVDYTTLNEEERAEYFGYSGKNKRRNIRKRNEKKKLVAISDIGHDAVPRYRRNKLIRKKARKAIRREEIAARRT